MIKVLFVCLGNICRSPLAEAIFKEKLQKVALSDDWKEKMLDKVEIWKKEQIQSSKSFAQNLDRKISDCENKLDKLINSFLDETIDKETYVAKKEELVKKKKDLLDKKLSFAQKGNNWIEPLKDWIICSNQAKNVSESRDFKLIRILVEKIGTNHRLLDRVALSDWTKPYDLLADRSVRTDWSGCRDSNPGPSAPKADALTGLRHTPYHVDRRWWPPMAVRA